MSERKSGAAFKTTIGGQALMEGILMRGPEETAIVVRTADGLVTKVEPTVDPKKKHPILGWRFLRGPVSFVVSMATGMKALEYSISCLPEEEQQAEETALDRWLNRKMGSEKAEKILMAGSMVMGVLLAIGLFILLPSILAGLFRETLGTGLLRNLAEGLLRVLIFLVYMYLVTLIPDISRMWMYHGAEHKTIACYENRLELTVENARKMTRFHPRCGTSFLFLVMLVSILVFSFVHVEGALMRTVLKLALLPVVVSISYELIQYAGKHDNAFSRVLSAPGKALQRLTTREPEDDMLEVAIEALKLVLPTEAGSDRI